MEAKKWHVIQVVELTASAKEVWGLVGGFFTIHTWHPDIATTEIPLDQTSQHEIRRFLTFPGPPISTTTEQLIFIDNNNWYYKYKWYAGKWGEEIKDYHSEIRVLETVPDQQCIVQWSSTFIYTEDALSAFYLHGFEALKKRFGTPK